MMGSLKLLESCKEKRTAMMNMRHHCEDSKVFALPQEDSLTYLENSGTGGQGGAPQGGALRMSSELCSPTLRDQMTFLQDKLPTLRPRPLDCLGIGYRRSMQLRHGAVFCVHMGADF